MTELRALKRRAGVAEAERHAVPAELPFRRDDGRLEVGAVVGGRGGLPVARLEVVCAEPARSSRRVQDGLDAGQRVAVALRHLALLLVLWSEEGSKASGFPPLLYGSPRLR